MATSNAIDIQSDGPPNKVVRHVLRALAQGKAADSVQISLEKPFRKDFLQ